MTNYCQNIMQRKGKTMNITEDKTITIDQNALYMTVVNNGQMACRLVKRLPPAVVLEMVAEILGETNDETD